MTDPAWSEAIDTLWPLLVALVLGGTVLWGLRRVARRAQAQGPGHLRARVARVIAMPAAFALPLLFLSVAVSGMPLPPRWVAWIQHGLGVGGLLCLTWLLVRAVGAVERRILRENPLDVTDNLHARRVQTQTRVLSRLVQGAVMLVGVSLVLMTFPAIRQVGATLLASAGVVGLVAGIAARPVFGNLIAGLQIALTQPIRLDDVVIVEGEWGRVDEITSAYVVVRVWDERRLIVPLQWFIEHPFQNWTRTSAQLLGTAMLWLDYRTPMDEVRQELSRLCRNDARWDGRVCVAQITETDATTIQVRLLVSARNSGDLFDLRCAVREGMVEFLRQEHPGALPTRRAELARREPAGHRQSSGRPTRRHRDRAAAPTRSPGAEDVTQSDRPGPEDAPSAHAPDPMPSPR